MNPEILIETLSEFEVFEFHEMKKEGRQTKALYQSEGRTCLLEITGKKGQGIKAVTLSMGFLTDAMERNSQTLGIAMGMIKAFFPEWTEGPACIMADCGELASRDQRATGAGRRIWYKPGIYSVTVQDVGDARILLTVKK